MATRSTIAILRDNGTVAQVYCHWDGYLSNNGQILLDHYKDPAKIEKLIALGDISSLGPDIGEKHSFDSAADYPDTTFYGRDRGETGTEARVFKDLADYEANMQSEEYDYLFLNGEWVYRSYDGLVRTVEDGLEMESAEEAE